jgi:plastocyanin
MLRHRHRIPAAVVGVGVAAVLLVGGCSASGPSPQVVPSIDFGSLTVTPGMAGHTGAGAPAAPPVASATVAAPPPAPGPAAGAAVSISNFAFVPATLTVPVGTTVTWTNQDEEPHTIAAKDGSFHSAGLDTHGTYAYTFHTVGGYDYICSIHPFMTGPVVVTK